MSSVLVRALVAALPFMDTRPGPHAAPVHGAAFGHAVSAPGIVLLCACFCLCMGLRLFVHVGVHVWIGICAE
eukprot:scaffold22999_cov25-Tisochrysis_lutea.AAC.1